jgi:hypothetical protein
VWKFSSPFFPPYEDVLSLLVGRRVIFQNIYYDLNRVIIPIYRPFYWQDPGF